MSHDGPVHTDVVVTIEIQELLFSELCAMVRDNGVWDAGTMDDVHEESHRMLELNVREGPNLDPLGKFVDGDQ
jgi:hypothetical protein